MSINLTKAIAFGFALTAYTAWVQAAGDDFQNRCVQSVKQIASAWGTPAMDAYVEQGFAGDRDQFLIPEIASRDRLQLEVANVSDIKQKDTSTCDAAVTLRFVKPEKDHSRTPVSSAFGGRWIVRVPDASTEIGAYKRYNAVSDKSRAGKAMLRAQWKLPEGTREAFLDTELAKDDGFTKAEQDDNTVLSPLQPASGWLIRLGDKETKTESDGSFVLEVLPNSPTTGEIINPATKVVFQQFTLDDLVEIEGGEPQPIIIDLLSHGTCGMDHDNPEQCPSM